MNNIPNNAHNEKQLSDIIRSQIKDIRINEILFNKNGTLIKVIGSKSFNAIKKFDWGNTELKKASTVIDKDTRPWLCINKIAVDVEANVITSALTVAGYDCDSVLRATKKDGTPITLIKFRVDTEENFYRLLREGFKLGDKSITPT